ncbi:unnamed protein product [Pedinophyceae sp. YPF-701]|nr:unnamed protein product [Pedinophyceae sp. YPF-701]
MHSLDRRPSGTCSLHNIASHIGRVKARWWRGGPARTGVLAPGPVPQRRRRLIGAHATPKHKLRDEKRGFGGRNRNRSLVSGGRGSKTKPSRHTAPQRQTLQTFLESNEAKDLDGYSVVTKIKDEMRGEVHEVVGAGGPDDSADTGGAAIRFLRVREPAKDALKAFLKSLPRRTDRGAARDRDAGRGQAPEPDSAATHPPPRSPAPWVESPRARAHLAEERRRNRDAAQERASLPSHGATIQELKDPPGTDHGDGDSDQELPFGSLREQLIAAGFSDSLPVAAAAADRAMTASFDEDLAIYGGSSEEWCEHLVPLVGAMVASVDPAARLLELDPPGGLLDLGRRDSVLPWLDDELRPYIALGGPTGAEERMPTRAALEDAGRRDLVAAITRLGGFLDVALKLSIRGPRRPNGYWDQEEVLLEEIAKFVASSWIQYTDEDGGEYWFNSVTRRVRWERPQPPMRVPLGDADGSYVFVEDLEDRVMPSRSALYEAGRYDLHHAIVQRGGYKRVAEDLDRQPAWPPSRPYQSDPLALADELRDAALEIGLDPGVVPGPKSLYEHGRADLAAAVAALGGVRAVAERLGMRNVRASRGQWDEAQDAARGLLGYVVEREDKFGVLPDDLMDAWDTVEMVGGYSVMDLGVWGAFAERERWEVPTQRELREAGRCDLLWALQKHGAETLATLSGLKARTRGRPRSRRRDGGGNDDEDED